MKDHLGREMKIGNFIVYGNSRGSSAGIGMASGYIVDLKEESTPLPDWNGKTNRVRVTYRIKVERMTSARRWSMSQKHSTLMFPDRCVIVDPSGVDFKTLQEADWR